MAGTIYTESVVTLNASQAEATMNALKSSADELRQKMIEATRLGNTEDAAKFQQQLDKVNKSMSSIKKETRDYSEIMKRLNGSTLNELSKAYSGLNRQIKNLTPGTEEFIRKSKQLQQVKARMAEINGSVKGTNKTLDSLKGLLPKLGIASVFAVASKAIVQFGKDAITQTQQVGDRWNEMTHGMRNAYNTFVADLTTGTGWRELIQNMTDSYKVGKEVEAMLDEIFERQNALKIKESEYNIEIGKNTHIMRDQTKSYEERLAAANEVMDLEKKLAVEKKEIAAQEADARKKDLQDRTGMTDAELQSYVAGYNKYRDIIKQAQAYRDEVARLEKAVRRLNFAYVTGDDNKFELAEKLDNAKLALETYKANADQTIVEWAKVDAKYQLSNDVMVQNYVESLAAMNNAEAAYYQTTSRSASSASSFKKQLSQEQLKASEDAYKAEIAGVEQHQKEMEQKAKEAYAAGEINEQQYQERLIAIKETALKSKLAISERYKQNTIDYQSQLLDLTIKQQEELMKIFEQAETDAAKVLADIMAESEAEIAETMQEIDADFAAEIDHLLDLAEQADVIKALLDPKTELGQKMQEEMDSLQEMYDNKLLTEEEYQQAKQKVVKDYAKQNLKIELSTWQQGLEVAQQYTNQVSKMVSALKDAEMAQLDAQMQAELTAAGDNADKRQQIEAEYEEKKLETQKKYAVADMVVNIAKTIAAGALSVMQCFAQLGPIAGAVMAAVVGVTTAAEIATIVAQKNAIMNTTVNSSGSAASGARVATGYSSGGYTTESSNDYQEVGVVHANEWVAPASMVRANPILFRRLEHARQMGTTVSGVSGFADGGMTSPDAPAQEAASVMDPAVLEQLTSVLQHIIDNGIPAYVLLSELNSKQELSSLFKKISGKKS